MTEGRRHRPSSKHLVQLIAQQRTPMDKYIRTSRRRSGLFCGISGVLPNLQEDTSSPDTNRAIADLTQFGGKYAISRRTCVIGDYKTPPSATTNDYIADAILKLTAIWTDPHGRLKSQGRQTAAEMSLHTLEIDDGARLPRTLWTAGGTPSVAWVLETTKRVDRGRETKELVAVLETLLSGEQGRARNLRSILW